MVLVLKLERSLSNECITVHSYGAIEDNRNDLENVEHGKEHHTVVVT